MTEADIAASRYIGRAAGDALNAEMNRPRGSIEAGSSPFQRHILRTNPECCWIAEAGLPIGYAMGFVRGDVWCLSQLFVYPDFQSAGVGLALLRRSMGAGRLLGARIRAVVSSPSLAAQSLYLRADVVPRVLLYRLEGSAAALLNLPPAAANQKRIVDCRGWLDAMSWLDTQVWGADRRVDHEFYLSPESLDGAEQRSYALTQGGHLVGYGYAYRSAAGIGYIAPLASAEPKQGPGLLRMAGEWFAERRVETVRASIISHNRDSRRCYLSDGGSRAL